MLPFRLPVLGFLFVSFHPSRLRSHSCSTGASLLFRFLSSASFPGFSACLPHSFVRFRLLLTTQPSALSFPLFPISPGSGSLGALRFLASPLLSSSVGPVSMPSFRFQYSASCVSFLRFAVSPHSGYLSSWPPVSSSATPLCFRFRFRLLGLSFCVLFSASDVPYITTATNNCQYLFCAYFNYYIALYFRNRLRFQHFLKFFPTLFRFFDLVVCNHHLYAAKKEKEALIFLSLLL